MITVTIPDWLRTYIDEHGDDVGKYTFAPVVDGSINTVQLERCPRGFVGIAEGNNGNGLAVAEKPDTMVYRVEEGEISVYATNLTEMIAAVRRDETWDGLTENMPTSQPYWIGIVLKAKDVNGHELTLGFKGETRQSAMVIRGRVEADEILADALTRELNVALGIDNFEVLDLIDDGGMVDNEGVEEPLFTVTAEVEKFDPRENIQEDSVAWIRFGEKKLTN